MKITLLNLLRMYNKITTGSLHKRPFVFNISGLAITANTKGGVLELVGGT